MWLELKNPHSVLAALEERPGEVGTIRLGGKPPTGVWREVTALAERVGVRVEARRSTEARGGRRKRVPEPSRTPAAMALVRPRAPLELERLFEPSAGADRPPATTGEEPRRQSHKQHTRPATVAHRPRSRRLWLGLDGLQDPQNVGAIFRTAAFFGVDGIVVTEHRSAPLSSTVYDVASGGMEYVPFAIVPKLRAAIRKAKQLGAWVLGTSEHAPAPIQTVDRERDWFVLLGGEQSGLRRLTREECDELRAIPPAGTGVTSLNVSVAAGIVIATLRLWP
ncbi:MAG: 23S rRNA (guanosine(2251)-2'-O)-methyltransferase RlmB [Planctomycetota bacterium]|nr:MAG: 23S rRNA (guanosine(2251)-2'-O)-methyltransferase RlmB [Planctomycetota bacterium]